MPSCDLCDAPAERECTKCCARVCGLHDSPLAHSEWCKRVWTESLDRKRAAR